MIIALSGLEDIKLFMLDSNIIKFIKLYMLKSKDIYLHYLIKSVIHHGNKCSNAIDCWQFNIYEHNIFHALFLTLNKIFNDL